MTGQENQCRRMLSLSLLKATVPSDEIGSSSDCEKPYSGLKPVETEALRKVLMQHNPK
jgi:hypothetical protein